ncbi:MAG TPA: NDP-hexose 2,3-dehydratase family protein [Rugosimonospora sp.]|nr:NDP-hexose 2,3-dehydratase family protein [Rugosimonospora sp.]
MLDSRSATTPRTDSEPTHLRLLKSARERDPWNADVGEVRRWFADFGRRAYTEVHRIALSALENWHTDPATGDIRHDAGRFFVVEGLEVSMPDAPIPRWSQPIINQPEVGILGILAKEFDGVLHFLMQAKVEPGNRDGLQLSPTVQATRSNYTRVHRGKAVPYLHQFLDTRGHRVIGDVRQSEQGSWFYRKRNRNMVVEVTGDVEVLDGFRWLTLGQIHALLGVEDLVNMDARTALSCLPFTGPGLGAAARGGGRFRAALMRSCAVSAGSRHSMGDVLSWITAMRCTTDITTRLIPLNAVTRWHHSDERIAHESGRFFSVIGVSVTAAGREVGHWTQPMIEPNADGLVALLVKDIDGVLHVLMQAHVEPGYLDVVELGPTVQCIPVNHEMLAPEDRPRFLHEVQSAPADRIRFDTVLSEEGGRFFHALNRYVIVETDCHVAEDPRFRWMTVHQLVSLLRHSCYLNVQARSMVACLHSLLG